MGILVKVARCNPGGFGKLFRERIDQPIVISSGIGKPYPEVQKATTFLDLYPALPFRQSSEEIVANPMRQMRDR
ncbi:hypothetical protein [Tabrizicola sp.]|uniref:hypothetical protein n=1 Tax=Tabrizicola sp. TaxID=2005166 RepID=UPI00286AC957|nr:hypothetical protein [Tabrizicola sp.]